MKLLGLGLILRFKIGKRTLDEKSSEMLPAITQNERSECKNSPSSIDVPMILKPNRCIGPINLLLNFR